ncbi:glycosyltransferase family A protein [Aquibium sp. LZ166]|uniref:Glycosyltransferase family A protein n=1 Tax=Aquibium pacificus TaxID=3153579 RepID=A0ABV3SIP6_9HYPH
MTFEISLIIPVRGDGPFLGQALESVAVQGVSIAELLVVDDGMTQKAFDAIAPLANEFGDVKILRGPRSGPAAARNVGLRAATGTVIAFIDDDDLWPDGKLRKQCGMLAQDSELEAVGGRIHWFSQWDGRGRPVPAGDDLNVVHVNLGAFVYRRGLFDKIGLLDEGLLYSEDVDLLLRMVDSDVAFAILDEPMLHYRRHAGTMTHIRTPREKADLNRSLLASLKRRRIGGAVRPGKPLEHFLVRCGT